LLSYGERPPFILLRPSQYGSGWKFVRGVVEKTFQPPPSLEDVGESDDEMMGEGLFPCFSEHTIGFKMT